MEPMWIAACIAALLLLGMGGILFALTRSSKANTAAPGTPKPGAAAPAGPSWWSKVKFGPGWVFPILVWVAFWISLYRYLPGTWNFVCDDPWIFWLAQGIYLAMIIGGRNLVDKDKKPRKPTYPRWILFATICIVVYGKLSGGGSPAAVPPKSSATKQGVMATAKTSPTPTTPSMGDESLPPIDVTVIVPGSDSRSKREIVAPVGYAISDDTWSAKVQLATQTELDDGSVASTFVSRTWEPVEVTFHLVPQK